MANQYPVSYPAWNKVSKFGIVFSSDFSTHNTNKNWYWLVLLWVGGWVPVADYWGGGGQNWIYEQINNIKVYVFWVIRGVLKAHYCKHTLQSTLNSPYYITHRKPSQPLGCTHAYHSPGTDYTWKYPKHKEGGGWGASKHNLCMLHNVAILCSSITGRSVPINGWTSKNWWEGKKYIGEKFQKIQ